jgi:hypothetical protein
MQVTLRQVQIEVFAWEQVDYGAYIDPEFLKPFESQGFK